MTIRVQIGTSERTIDNIEPNWITEQINRRKREDAPLCVKVFVNTGQVNLVLASSGCPQGIPGQRKANMQEQKVFDIWERLRLNEPDFSPGNLVAFLKQLRS